MRPDRCVHGEKEFLSELQERNQALEQANRELRRRTEFQAALGELARALGDALSLHEVVEGVATHSVELTRAFGAYVERIEFAGPEGTVEIVAVAGKGVPPLGTRVPYPGSLTEEILESGEPRVMAQVTDIGESMAPYIRRHCQRCTGVIVPLRSAGEGLGALVLLRGPDQESFTPDEATFVRALGDIASAALRRVMLLEGLRDQEARFRALAETATDAIVAISEDDRIVYANPATGRIFGYSPDELTGRRLSELMPERYREQHIAGVRRFLETGERRIPWDGIELPGLHRSGHEIPLEITFGHYIRDSHHTFTGVLRDITERKRLVDRVMLLGEASRILASSLEFDETLNRLARLTIRKLADYCVIDVLQNGGDLRRVGIAHRDPEKEAAIRALGHYTPDWKSRSPAIEALRSGNPQIVPEIDEFWADVTGQTPGHRELIRYLAPKSAIVAPLRGRDRVLGVFWLARSESDARYTREDLELAEELARRTSLFVENSRLFEETRVARLDAERRAGREEALRRAAAAVGAANTIADMVEQIAQSALTSTEANGVVVEQIDWAKNEVEVSAVAGQRTLPVGGRMKYAGSLAELIVERGRPEIIPTLTAANNRISAELRDACLDCRVLAVPLKETEETVGVLILLRDPWEEPFRPEEVDHASIFADLATLAFRKVRLLEQSEAQREELGRVMESRTRLIRGFSHDVKNPLGAADGYLQLLEDGVIGPLSDKQKESLGRARRSIGAALRLMVDLTELARAESGTIEIAHEPVDLCSVVRDAVEEYRAGAESQGLTLEVAIPAHLPTVQTDAMRIRQVLGNLISNATKYTEHGGITVRCAMDETGAAPCTTPCVRIDVTDTGPGIPEEDQTKLFGEFTRLKGAGRAPGAGIGLAISSRIAGMLGGALTLTHSELGVGSTFTLWLPLQPPA